MRTGEEVTEKETEVEKGQKGYQKRGRKKKEVERRRRNLDRKTEKGKDR